MLARTLLIAAALVLAACATQDNFTTVSREQFRNDEGKVVGHRELPRNKDTGELVHKVELYAVLTDADGKIVGYEQRTRSGSVVYDDEGRPIGTRMVDLRSKGSNPASRGVIFMY
jgi:YD repeat-containing protein